MMIRKMAMLLAAVLGLSALGGCVIYPPGASSRARRQVEKIEERIENEMGRLGERLEELGDYPELEDRLSKVDVYDAKGGQLLGTLESREDLRAFEEALADDRYNDYRDLRGIFAEPDGAAEYRFEAYVASKGIADAGKLYRALIITTFEGSDTVHLEVAAAATNMKPIFAMNVKLGQSQVDALRAMAESAA